MPFAINDVLQHKRNDRQKREIHEKEYSKYITNLRQSQQQQQLYYKNQYHLSPIHQTEIERAHMRNAVSKKYEYDRIQRENYMMYDRLLKASNRTAVDDKNYVYEENLKAFTSKRSQQRSNQYKRIEHDNHIFLERINNIQGRLISKRQCDNDWKKHITFMKKTSNYPEYVDKFVAKTTKDAAQKTPFYFTRKSIPWDDRHYVTESSNRLSVKPLSVLLDEY